MQTTVVTGAQYGDEGKGKITLALCEGKDLCVRWNGSNNAGHTIYKNGKKLITHSIPTGIIQGVRSLIGHGCVVNVEHLMNEIEEFENSDVNVIGKLFVSELTHVITDEHKSEDAKEEKIGSTKRGNGPCYRDKYARTGSRLKDIKATLPSELRSMLVDPYEFLKPLYREGDKTQVLAEGAQGFGIDIDWGEYPFVTSSHCTTAMVGLNGIPTKSITKVYGVGKWYETYVGKNKFESDDPVLPLLREAGAEFGATTGRPRQCNWLNLATLVKSCHINEVTNLVLNKEDILKKVGVFKLFGIDGVLKEFGDFDSYRNYVYEEMFNNCPTVKKIHSSNNPNGF